MKVFRLNLWLAQAVSGLAVAVSAPATPLYVPSLTVPPQPLREFRAAWIATVANIDWPSKKDLTAPEQKAELIAILDRASKLDLNTLIFQVRPACDAMYSSALEPWSEYLTGTMGRGPEPFYDPLAFMVDEAHKRGIELHAWFNPYRARQAGAKSPVSSNHVSRTHPEMVRQYGKHLWLDPGEKSVQDYSKNIILDVVKRYDIDGVHLDDYFYPYKENDSAGRELDFPDDASWKKFGAGGRLRRDDWRRENVNTFIETTYHSIKAAKPWVKFGISPFGIWRPGNPPQIKGFDPYEKLFADSRKWLQNGWVDYFAPQLYWSIDSPEQSFPVLLNWWAAQNPKGRHLLPGLDSTHTLKKWKPEEIVNQIRLIRKQRGADGHIHWNMKSLMRNEALDDALLQNVYSMPALSPASPWLGNTRLGRAQMSIRAGAGRDNVASWTLPDSQHAWLWLVQWRSTATADWHSQILPGQKSVVELPAPLPECISVTAIDRTGNSSAACVLQTAGSVTRAGR
jgi:uncharacterized lipoprotein YddW (UPF0748 family)